MAQPTTQIYLNGKLVKSKKDLPKDAKLKDQIRTDHYETPEFSAQQSINIMKFFENSRSMREEMEKYHG